MIGTWADSGKFIVPGNLGDPYSSGSRDAKTRSLTKSPANTISECTKAVATSECGVGDCSWLDANSVLGSEL